MNCLTIFSTFSTMLSFYLISDTDLHNVIKKSNILKDIHKRYIMYQMLKATAYMHSGNVIHRDQKVRYTFNESTKSDLMV